MYLLRYLFCRHKGSHGHVMRLSCRFGATHLSAKIYLAVRTSRRQLPSVRYITTSDDVTIIRLTRIQVGKDVEIQHAKADCVGNEHESMMNVVKQKTASAMNTKMAKMLDSCTLSNKTLRVLSKRSLTVRSETNKIYGIFMIKTLPILHFGIPKKPKKYMAVYLSFVEHENTVIALVGRRGEQIYKSPLSRECGDLMAA